MVAFCMYNRLFTKILDSSIWLEPTTTRIVWITLLAAMDEEGYAHFSAIENLASRARVSKREAQKAIDCFLAPDSNSENPANEGRRVERVPGGFLILNADDHRKMLNREIRREQTRLRVAKHREKKDGSNKESVTGALRSVTPASASAVTSEAKRKPSTQDELLGYAKEQGISGSDAIAFWDSMEAGGWTRNGKVLKDWKAHLRSYKSNGYLASQRRQRNGARADDLKNVDPSKVDLPERFKAWAAQNYPDKREAVMKWRTWADVPNSLRQEWWREEKDKLPVEI